MSRARSALRSRRSRGTSASPTTRRVASGTALAVLASTLVVLAIRADGTPITDVDLNDGGVWVSNSEQAMIARLNPDIKELDLGVVANSGQIDIHQRADRVYIDSLGEERLLTPVDVPAGEAAEPVALPAQTVTAFGRDTIALLDRKSGKYWIRTPETVAGFSAKEDEPNGTVAPGGAVAVTPEGVAHVLDVRTGEVARWTIGEAGVAEADGTATLRGSLPPEVTLTVVGSTPVALDETTGTVHRVDADPITVPGDVPESVRLVEPTAGSALSDLWIASGSGLWRTGAASGDLDQRVDDVSGAPAPPVVFGDCVYTAWADPRPEADSFRRLCDDSSDDLGEAIPSVMSDSVLRFRHNRGIIVLNDTRYGLSWIVQDGSMDLVNNWQDVNPNEKRREPKDLEKVEAERDEENRPPKALDDEFGARPGQATILPVTANDTDPDGDILTVKPALRLLSGEADLVRVGEDTQVQFTPPADTEGRVVFEYQIDDGRGLSATAKVTVDVKAGGNKAPKLLENRTQEMKVGLGKSNSYFVLPDWTDPDGDDLSLVDATTSDGGEVTFRPDGTIEFTDDGSRTGAKTITYEVSDGGEVTRGKIAVDVSSAKNIAPELVPDRAMGVAGQKSLVQPLLNDRNPDGTDLQLKSVRTASGGSVELVEDVDAGTFTALASRPGSYYLDYEANNFGATARSYIRFDVVAPMEDNRPPVAVKDHALLPPGGTTMVDLLANDFDPDNDVLVVNQIEGGDDSGLKASLIDKKLLRLEATRDLAEPVQLTYTVTDGQAATTGSVVVTQRSRTQENRPPVARDDRVSVRAGSVASIDALTNDSDPDGDQLSLVSADLDNPHEDLTVFVSGDDLRLRAPDEPGEYRVTYGTTDAGGLRASAVLIVSVLADTAERNRSPQPSPIEDRVMQGQTRRIDINVQGSDPDGDAVGFKGLLQAPQYGRIVTSGADWVEYEPYPGMSGTDRFQIAVEDKYGARGITDVRIGVAPRAEVNQPPVALADELLIRSDRDRTIQYNVVVNDVDPDGDEISVLDQLVTGPETEATLDRQFVQVEVPASDAATKHQVGYSITDRMGGQDLSTFVVSGRPDAPLHAPVTQDDSGEAHAIAGKSPGDTIDVDVLDNDIDLDGSKADLRLEAVDDDVSRVDDGVLTITLAETDQVVVYRVVDADDQESFGFVFVSGTDNVPPVIDPDTVPVEITQGESVEMALDDHVLVRAGRTPVLTVEDEVRAVGSDNGPLVKSGTDDVLTFTPREGHVGPASVTFEVTDGEGLNDPTGLTSLLTIPIDVVPAGNVAPTLRSTTMLVSPEEPERLELTPLVEDANEDDEFEFSVELDDDVISAEIDGSELVVTASADARNGDQATATLAVTDGDEEATATVRITVTSSTEPLVTIAPIEIEGEAGNPVTVDIADYASNPFPGEPLTVSAATVESGEAGAPSVSGTNITITPRSGTAGVTTVKFTVSDATGDAERDVVGRIRVIVSDVPDAPARPTVSNVEASSVQLTWREPANNGAPITRYVVEGSGGFRTECTTTSCQLDGLTPGDGYTFRVAAVNSVGEGDFSPSSESVTPDEVPGIMSAPRIEVEPTAMDGQLRMTWTEPENRGSAISNYEIQMIGGGSREVSGALREYTWSGLTNGETYRFAIRAVNKVAERQQFSAPSDAVKPFGVPGVVDRPTAQTLRDGAGGGKAVSVTWKPPSDNGDPISGYRVVMYEGSSSQTFDVPAGTTSRDFTVSNGVDYSFTVTAQNRAGWSASPSQRSNVVNPYGEANAPRITGKGDEFRANSSGIVDIRFTTPTDNGGRPVTKYMVRTNGARGTYEVNAPTTAQGAAGTIAVDFGATSGPYWVSLTPISFDGSTRIVGAESTRLEGVRPYGPVRKPTASANANGTAVTVRWGPPQANGRPIDHLLVTIDGNQTKKNPSAGSQQINAGYDSTHRIRVVAVDSEGQKSDPVTAEATTGSRPKRVDVTLVPAGRTFPGVCSSNCHYIHISVSGFDPGTRKLQRMYHDGRADFVNEAPYCSTITVGADGNGQNPRQACYTGWPETLNVVFDGVRGTARR